MISRLNRHNYLSHSTLQIYCATSLVLSLKAAVVQKSKTSALQTIYAVLMKWSCIKIDWWSNGELPQSFCTRNWGGGLPWPSCRPAPPIFSTLYLPYLAETTFTAYEQKTHRRTECVGSNIILTGRPAWRPVFFCVCVCVGGEGSPQNWLLLQQSAPP